MMITDVREETAVDFITGRLGNNIDDSSAGAPQLCRIIATINLKLLNSFLAQGGAHSAIEVIRFGSVNRNAIAATIAAIKRQPARPSLHNAKVGAVSNGGGVADPWCKQAKGQVIAPV